jgi:hypothetical protein
MCGHPVSGCLASLLLASNSVEVQENKSHDFEPCKFMEVFLWLRIGSILVDVLGKSRCVLFLWGGVS